MAKHRRLPTLLYFALAHHYDDRLNRTILLRLFGWEQYFCTRCTAQWVSFASFACVAPFFTIELQNFIWTLVLFVLPLPALVDWASQSWQLRESTTPIRVLTGSALGMGYGLEFQAVIELNLTRTLLGIGVYAAYMTALIALLKIRPFSSDVFG